MNPFFVHKLDSSQTGNQINDATHQSLIQGDLFSESDHQRNNHFKHTVEDVDLFASPNGWN